VKLARAPGEREARWAHLLAGPVEPRQSDASPSVAAAEVSLAEIAALRSHHAQLAAEVAELRTKLERMAAELGLRL